MATTAPRPSDLDAPLGGLRFDECADEEDLARRVAEADEAAFAALYERHYQALYRYCRSIVRDDLDAQDALQTAWTRALVALRQGRRDAPVRPWLYRIVHNEAISLLRRRHRGPEPTEAHAHGDPGASPPHGVPSAEESAIARERFALLMSDLGRLPERPRGALLMRELSGLSHEEIAAALQTSVAAAKQCIYEARRDLAELAAGRATPCDEICSSISGGDRRALRARRVKAHLSDCPSCASFASAIDDRRQALHAALPWLGAPAAITLLDRVLRSASGTVSSAGAGAGAAAGGSAGAAGPMAAVGTAAPAAVAGGVVTKAVGASLLAKAALAAAALTAGALSLGGMGTTSGGASQRAPVARGPSAPTVRGHRSSARLVPSVSAPGPRGRTVVPGHAPGGVAPGRANKGALPPGQVKTASGTLPPGEAKKASRPPALGQAKKTAGSVAAGHANQASGSAPPGQAKRASGTPASGQVKKTSGSGAAGHANQASGSVAAGHANQTSGSVASRQVNKGSSGQANTAPSVAATNGQGSTASSVAVVPGQVRQAATGSSATTPSPASIATGAPGHAPAK